MPRTPKKREIREIKFVDSWDEAVKLSKEGGWELVSVINKNIFGMDIQSFYFKRFV